MHYILYTDPPPTHAHTNTHMLANLFHMFSCFLVFFRKLEDLSVDEFMQAGFASESDEETKQQSGLNKRNKKKQLESKAFTTWVFWSGVIICTYFIFVVIVITIWKPNESGCLFIHRDDGKKGKASQHKEQLSRLKNKDPAFYKFLQANDQTLLNFDDTDSSDDEDEKKYHKLPSALEVSWLMVCGVMIRVVTLPKL